LDAQNEKELPQRIRREVYVEWCNLAGVDLPLSISDCQKNFEARLSAFEHELDQESDALDSEIAIPVPKRSPSQSARADNNNLRIFLAVLLESKLIDAPLEDLSRRLADLCEKKRIRQTNGRPISGDMITGRLMAAHYLRAEFS
jgi:hypothetical protein